MLIDHTPDALFHCGVRKVQQQPYGLLHQAQIGQNLLEMSIVKPFDQFDLNHDAASHQQIDTKRLFVSSAAKLNCHRNLSLDKETAALQFAKQDQFINAFKQARPKLAVNADAGINDF